MVSNTVVGKRLIGDSRRLPEICLLALAILLVRGALCPAATVYWSVPSGNWSSGTNWGGTEPAPADTAYIGNGGTATITSTGEACNYLYIGEANSGAVQMTGGDLTVSSTCMVGYSNTGTFTQSGGTHTNLGDLYLCYNAGSTATYALGGTGQLSTRTEYVGNSGPGTFTQNGGINTVSSYLYLGRNSNSSGTYRLSGTGQLIARYQSLGQSTTAVFEQTGGLNLASGIMVGRGSTTASSYLLTDRAQLVVTDSESVDRGTITQTGGRNSIAANLAVGVYSGSQGFFRLSGAGQLSEATAYIGDSGTGTFEQTGGNNTITTALYLGHNAGSTGAYNLSGAGQLSAGYEYIGSAGTGTFRQTGGVHTVASAKIAPTGTFVLSGGTVNVTAGFENKGIWDLSGSMAVVNLSSSIANLSGTVSAAGSNATLNLDSHSLLIVPGGHSPAEYFAHFNNAGGLVHQAGSTLSIPSNYNIAGTAAIDDHVDCQGTLSASGSYPLDLNGGVTVSGSGSVNLGKGSLSVNNAISGMSGGSLNVYDHAVGTTGSATFTHTGGSNMIANSLYLGKNAGNSGTYYLSDTGQLAAPQESVGYSGTGTFQQTGGTNNVSSTLYLAYDSGSAGTYRLSGTGQLSAGTEYVGRAGTGTFIQSGGTHTVSSALYLDGAGASTYELSAGQLSADAEYISYRYLGAKTFTQTGGVNQIATSLYLGGNSGLSGTYNLSGAGQLNCDSQYVGYLGVGSFVQSAGTNQVATTLYVGFGANGTYQLSGTGQLTAGTEYIGYSSTGSFTQSGGVNTAHYVRVNTGQTYTLSGGMLNLSGGGLEDKGTLDLSSSTAVINASSSIVNLSGTVRATAANATLHIDAHSLLILPSGHVPSEYFAHIDDGGCLVHQAGSPIDIPSTASISGAGSIADHVNCHGALAAADGLSIDLNGGLNVSNSASVALGKGRLYVNDATSGIDGGTLNTSDQYIGDKAAGTFTHTGGTNTLASLYLGGYGGAGNYALSGLGQVSATKEYVGYNNLATFTQTGGTNTVGDLNVNGSSTYTLSGTGLLSAQNEAVSGNPAGTFNQTGGTNLVAGNLYIASGYGAKGVYNLSGASQLSAGAEYIGTSDATATFSQTAGTNTATTMKIGGLGTYSLSGGVLNVNGGLENKGVWNLSNSTATINVSSSIVNLAGTVTATGGNATLNIDSHSLLIVPSGHSPSEYFSQINDGGSLVHQVGGPLTIPATSSIVGIATIADHVDCQGTLNASAGLGIDLSSGLNISGAGSVNLGSGTLFVKNALSGISGGSVNVNNEYIGYLNAGTPVRFVHSAGTNTVANIFYLGDSGARYTYELSGTALLSARTEWIGFGTESPLFLQTGGTNSAGSLAVATTQGYAVGAYELSGNGLVSASSESIGDWGTGTFTHSSGTNTVAGNLTLGNTYSAANGTYSLSGAGQLSALNEYIGATGKGTFNQTGGTNSIAAELTLAGASDAIGTYNLNGGTLILKSLRKGWGTAFVNLGGGTLQAAGDFNITLPIKLSGTGGNANVDTAGHAVTFSGVVYGLGGLNKRGAGTLTLASGGCHTGDTRIEEGTLALAANSPLPFSPTVFINALSFFDVSAQAGGYRVPGGQTIKGDGTILGSIIAEAGSSLAPGDGLGKLNIFGDASLAGGMLNIEYNGGLSGAIDMLAVSGALDLTGGTIDFAQFPGGGPLTDRAYIFASYGSTVSGNPILSNVPAGYHVEYAYNGNYMALVVPEPSTLAPTIMGLVGLICLLRRRRKGYGAGRGGQM